MPVFIERRARVGAWFDECRRWPARLRIRGRGVLPIVERNSHISPGAKWVALSIDDGPSKETTPALLRALKAHCVNATFFVLGSRAEENLSLVRDIVKDGHDVYAHGYSHRRFDRMTTEEILDEIERTEALLRTLRPTPSRYFVRTPHGAGAFDPHVHEALRRWNPSTCLAQWSISTRDWKISRRCRSAAQVQSKCAGAVDRIMNHPRLSGSIILLHDAPVGGEGEFVTEVSEMLLARLLRALHEDGYAVGMLKEAIED